MHRPRYLMVVVAVAATVALAAPPASSARTVGSGAFGVAVAIPIGGGAYVGVNPVPFALVGGAGGTDVDHLGTTTGIPGLVSVSGLHMATTGSPAGPVLAFSTADIAHAAVTVGGVSVVLFGVHSECLWTETRSTGLTRIAALAVNGIPITMGGIKPAPNTTRIIGGVRIVLNAHHITQTATTGLLTVDAARIYVGTPLGDIEVVIGESSCDPTTVPLARIVQGLFQLG